MNKEPCAVVAGVARYSSCDQRVWVGRERAKDVKGYCVAGMKADLV